MRRPRACLASTHSGGAGAPPGWPLRAAREELADDPESPDESAARRRDKNAASGAPKGERPDRKGRKPRRLAWLVTRCASRRSAPPHFRGRKERGRTPRRPNNSGGGALAFGICRVNRLLMQSSLSRRRERVGVRGIEKAVRDKPSPARATRGRLPGDKAFTPVRDGLCGRGESSGALALRLLSDVTALLLVPQTASD